MTKEEFIKVLRESLYTEITSIEIENNVRYYNEYIDNQIRSGKTMDQVMAELGDPRLIARTIIETAKLGKSNYNNTYQDAYTDTDDSHNNNGRGYSHTYTFDGKVPLRYRILGIAVLILIVMLIIFLGSIVIRLFVSIGIPILLVYILIRLITRR